MEDQAHIRRLFQSYLAGQATTEQTNELLNYFGTAEGSKYAARLIEEHFEHTDADSDPELLAKVYPMADRVGAMLNAKISTKAKTKKLWNPTYLAITAAAIAILALANYLYIKNMAIHDELKNNTIVLDASPGSNRATLTLADGKKINLSDAINGTLAEQSGLRIEKIADGELSYTIGTTTTLSPTLNTVATPRGGQFQVRLPDGTKVWLNAASSISYATNLSISSKRIVKLSGEAYFEVAHDQQRPFIVSSHGQDVQVHGTHFNVSSYQGESTVTTLAEGSVEIFAGRKSRMLIPGQQSRVNGSNLQVAQADLETALAWKEGNISFRSATIREIMQQVERWYDIEVVYEGQASGRTFTGGISRNSKLSALLKILEDSGVNFELRATPQGKTLIIKP